MPKNLSRETILKMRAVIDAVLANPTFYDQYKYPHEFDCGSVCCAAGFAVWIDSPRTYKRKTLNEEFDWQEAAEKVLGLGNTNSKLFWSHTSWPTQFYDMYEAAYSPLERARAMEARWVHFIKTDGRE
jgi:hypothetical protein